LITDHHHRAWLKLWHCVLLLLLRNRAFESFKAVKSSTFDICEYTSVPFATLIVPERSVKKLHDQLCDQSSTNL
jgi:hypothetical protein